MMIGLISSWRRLIRERLFETAYDSENKSQVRKALYKLYVQMDFFEKFELVANH